jgi:hypothetical protein
MGTILFIIVCVALLPAFAAAGAAIDRRVGKRQHLR